MSTTATRRNPGRPQRLHRHGRVVEIAGAAERRTGRVVAGRPADRVRHRFPAGHEVGRGLGGVDRGPRRPPRSLADECHRVVHVAPGPAVRGVRRPHRQPVEHAVGRKHVRHHIVLVLLVSARDPLVVDGREMCQQTIVVDAAQHGVVVRLGGDDARSGGGQRFPDHERALRQLRARRGDTDPDLGPGHVRQRVLGPHDGQLQHGDAPRIPSMLG